jgi:hypothetical protein
MGGYVFKSNTRSKLFLMLGAAFMAIALFASSAQAKEPAPGYTQFTGCPSPEENASIVACVRNTVTGGHFQMGNKDVPITQPMVLVGGTGPLLQGFAYNSKGGLLPAKQKVPGGVIGLTGLTWLVEFLGSEALTLYAQTELAGTPQLGFTSATLPIKVHLINGVLGNNCYVGSTSNPITLHLTTGTTSPPPPNTPITGKEAETSIDPEKEIIHQKNGIFVDNAFAAPGASGCVLTLFGFIPISINGLVNTQSGLPAPAGTNETIQNYEAEIAGIEKVYP